MCLGVFAFLYVCAPCACMHMDINMAPGGQKKVLGPLNWNYSCLYVTSVPAGNQSQVL